MGSDFSWKQQSLKSNDFMLKYYVLIIHELYHLIIHYILWLLPHFSLYVLWINTEK